MRRWGSLVIVVGVALSLLLLWWSLSVSDLSRGSQVATILVLPVTIIAVGIAMRAATPDGDGSVDAAVERLIEKVRADRKPFLRQALGVVWAQDPAEVRFTAPTPSELSPAIESLLVHWQQLDGDDRVEGTMASIAAFYREVQEDPSAAGRLMITGAPGSGKSVLASKLVVDLLTSLREEAGGEAVKVPVWLSLTGCGVDPKTSLADLPWVFEAWLGSEISDVYGLRARLAHSLVKERRILPVLDGLDELDPALAVAVVNALNHGVRQPVILTCRSGDYASLAAGEPVEARRPVLMDATHITLRPLEPNAIDRFLAAALTPEQRTRWAEVIAAVHQGRPIAAVLASPLRLSFAYLAYRDADDLAQLLRLTEDTAMAKLVEPAITTTVNNDPKANLNGWTSHQVLHWLECLAVNQRDHAQGSEYDILLPDLWSLGGRFLPRYLLPSAIAVAGVVCAVLAVPWRSLWMGPVAALVLGFGAREVVPQSTVERIVDPRTPAGRASLRTGLTVGLAVGMTIGLVVGLALGLMFWLAVGLTAIGSVVGLAVGLTVWLVVGLVFGPVVGLVFGMAAEPGGTRNCSRLMTQCLAYTLAVWLVVGLAGGVVVGLAGGLVVGLMVGLIGGLVFGMAAANGSTWFRYVIGTTQAARRGLVPHRLTSFLDWGLDVGLFRMSGYTLQFRHRDLYRALLTLRRDTGDPRERIGSEGS